ncbi:MAG TPA: EAL domain-containing protein [Gemmatimonadaceae bacterium]|nr:EAL domain-containing protein [Gemmatimonadaceae bacterium]
MPSDAPPRGTPRDPEPCAVAGSMDAHAGDEDGAAPWFAAMAGGAEAAGAAMALLQATLDAATDGILAVALDGRILCYNHRFVDLWQLSSRMTGPGAIEALLRHVGRQVADPDALFASVRAERDAMSVERVDLMECTDGRVMERHVRPLRVGGAIIGRVWNFRDVTERRRLEEELLRRTRLDPLTGLANRAHFRERVEAALCRTQRTGEEVGVLFLDLDDFKRVNDSFGHAEGDALLVAVAERLRRATRGCDTIARLGGDEFAVLLEDVRGGVTTVAERVAEAFARIIPLRGAEVLVTASIGVATSCPGLPADALLRNADVAMYEAKARGKGHYALFTPAMHAAVLVRLQLESELRAASTQGQFVLHYQPIVRLDSGETVGAEALVRWEHPERGLVMPSGFVAFAEQAGIIVPLGRWVLREACRQAAEWQRPGAPVGITVNVSARQLQEPTLLDDVHAALTDAGLPAACLSLEITESVLMEHTDATLATLHALKALGVRLALDDFGTGYSSLSCLDRFPIDTLKIDRAFVDAVGDDQADPVLARIVLSLGETLGLTTVAEGIEHARQVAGLRALGCELGQGYHFAHPLSAEEFAARLEGRTVVEV